MSNRFKCPSTWLSLVAALVLGLSSSLVLADENEKAISDRLTKNIPGLSVANVRKSDAPGLYEVQTSTGETVYATENGDFLLTGDLLQVTDSGIANVTETRRATRRADVLAEFGASGVIRFPAEGEEKAVVAVFTDIDCPYCRKLHDEMPKLNKMGITVDYYGFPRSGPGTASFKKYESVWCSDDQRKAMDAAKQGRQVAAKTCENPVRAQFELGGQIGVTGTPAIVLEDGNMVRGYVPAEKLAEGLGLL
ncbi:MAG: DsbC family protein [Marinobacter sp.]|uniref:DsbC family protein n=1 Tax=Marinobacter sp. TaxID=50741 RepID=UPI0034A066B0